MAKGEGESVGGRRRGFCADVAAASSDFKLREAEEYMSFFQVAGRDEGCRVAAAFEMVGAGRPAHMAFMLFPRSLLIEVGIAVVPMPDANQHSLLSSKHWGTVGPRHVPDEAFIRMLLSGNCKEITRMRKVDVVALARSLLAECPDLEGHLGVASARGIARQLIGSSRCAGALRTTPSV